MAPHENKMPAIADPLRGKTCENGCATACQNYAAMKGMLTNEVDHSREN